jgi:hypothetical protein
VIEVALVSDQLLANVLPALHDRPTLLVLVCTPEMIDRGARLQRVLSRHGIRCVLERDAPDAGLPTVHEFAFALLERLQRDHPGEDLVLNATGGTKPMMLGFVDVFRAEARIVYVDTRRRRIETLPKQGVEDPPAPMRDVLDVPGYLNVQGFAFESALSDRTDWRLRVASRKQAAKHLGRHATLLGSFIGQLNALASAAVRDDVLIEPVQTFSNVRSAEWRDALAQLGRCGVLRWAGEHHVEFSDCDAARFCAGGWLEEYVWHVVIDAHPHDARMSVTGRLETARAARNEFDLLAVHGNQMLVVECKTLKHGRDHIGDSDLLYKLDSLGRDARGLFGSS